MIWLENSVVTGLQMLLTLRLPGAPAEDTVPAVAAVWVAAFRRGRNLDWRADLGDAARIEQAFTAAAAKVDRWPSPARVLDELPPRVAITRRLPRDAKPMPDSIRASLKALMSRLVQPTRPRPPVPGEVEWPEIMAREAHHRKLSQQLQSGDRK